MRGAEQFSLYLLWRRTQSLKSLTLHCSEHVRPNADVLRRLCSCVHKLSPSADELLFLMAWDADPLYGRVWKSDRAQTFVLPAPPNHFNSELIVATLAASLPSLTHLHIKCMQEASSVSTLLQRMDSRLTLLQGSTASLLQPPSAALSCTALVSLCIYDCDECGCRAEEMSNMFACLTACPTLTELAVIARSRDMWPLKTIHLIALPQMRYLHLHIHLTLGLDETPQP